MANSDTGQIQHFVQTSATGTAIEPCQAPPLLPTNSDQVLNRLGKDEYLNLIVDLCSFSGIEEKVLLECSYADYLEGCDSVIIKSRLRVNVSFRETISTSQFILIVIREGYKIPFYYTPTLVHLQNNNSTLSYSDFVISAITELLKVGSVVECPFPPVVINPLSVSVQSNGKKRLILDLRTNKPMRMDFLSIFLEDFRGPRKMVFCLKITRSKSAGNHGTMRPKSTNFQSLVFIPKTDKLLL